MSSPFIQFFLQFLLAMIFDTVYYWKAKDPNYQRHHQACCSHLDHCKLAWTDGEMLLERESGGEWNEESREFLWFSVASGLCNQHAMLLMSKSTHTHTHTLTYGAPSQHTINFFMWTLVQTTSHINTKATCHNVCYTMDTSQSWFIISFCFLISKTILVLLNIC